MTRKNIDMNIWNAADDKGNMKGRKMSAERYGGTGI